MNNTSLFTNVFKSLFGSSITPTASQYVPITANDGTPAGISSIANLASVLGGAEKTSITQSDFDLNTITKDGIYYGLSTSVANSIVNGPTTDNGEFWLRHTSTGNAGYIIQVFCSFSTAALYSRRKRGDSGWSSWARVDNFGCSTASDLASLLGVISSVSQYISDSYDNVDDFPHGITVIDHRHKTIINNPFTSEVCVVITIIPLNTATTNSVFQIGYRDGVAKYRIRWVNSWSSWKEI